MANIFDSVLIPKPKRSKHNLSHTRLLTSDFGKLVPILALDCVPGDKVKLSSSCFIRTAPMLSPSLTPCTARIDYFFVPYRLVWDDFKDFITGGEDGTLAPAPPYITVPVDSPYNKAGSLFDHLGIPTEITRPVNNVTLMMRAYNMIFNEWYRDQNTTAEVPVLKTSGQEVYDANRYSLRHRCWRKDMFTSALQSPQRGVAVPINTTTQANLQGSIVDIQPFIAEDTNATRIKFLDLNGNLREGELMVMNGGLQFRSTDGQTSAVSSGGNDVSMVNSPVSITSHDPVMIDGLTISIQDIRRANAVQVWLERNSRAGGRYVEQILAHFGIHTPDYRLDRPEYLGGATQPVQVNSVMNMTEQQSSQYADALGSLGGTATSIGFAKGRKTYRVEEHGCVIGLLSIMPQAMYFQGVPRHFIKNNKFEWLFPEFANLGEQPIYIQELYRNEAAPENYFGYEPRYAEYRFVPNTIHGDFRTSLKFWHQAREFQSTPSLTTAFVNCKANQDGINRIWAVNTAPDGSPIDHFWVQVNNNVFMKRPLPKYGIPSLNV